VTTQQNSTVQCVYNTMRKLQPVRFQLHRLPNIVFSAVKVKGVPEKMKLESPPQIK